MFKGMGMTDYLVLLNRWALVAFVLCTMTGVGLLLQLGQIFQVLRQRRQLGLTLLANFVVLPSLAWWVCRRLDLDVSIQAAILLATTAPGCPTLLRLNAAARGDQALAVSMYVLLSVLTVAFQPLVLPWLLQGVQVSSSDIVRSLGLTVLVPLVLGLSVRARWPIFAEQARRVLEKAGSLSALLVLILFPVLYFDAMLSVLRQGALMALLLYMPLTLGVGWWLGSASTPSYRRVLTLCCGQGNMGIAFVSAAANFKDPTVGITLVVMLFLTLLPLAPIALFFGRTPAQTH